MRRGIYGEIKKERARAKETKSERAVEGKRERGKAAEQKLARKIKGEQPVSIK